MYRSEDGDSVDPEATAADGTDPCDHDRAVYATGVDGAATAVACRDCGATIPAGTGVRTKGRGAVDRLRDRFLGGPDRE